MTLPVRATMVPSFFTPVLMYIFAPERIVVEIVSSALSRTIITGRLALTASKAQIGAQDPYFVERNAEQPRHVGAHTERSLRVGPHGNSTVRFDSRRGDARFEILRMDHLGLVDFVDNDVRFRHRLIG